MAANTRSLLICLIFSSGIINCFAQNDTTTAPTTTTAPLTTEAPSTPTPIPQNTDLAECTCDLTAGGCDVNCCCDDNDCTTEDKEAFSSCIDSFDVVESQACVRSDIIFTHNTEQVVNESVPGLFCVQFDNLEARNYYNPPEVLIEDEQTFTDYLDQYGLGYSFSTESTPSNSSNMTDFYRSGDPIYTVYETDSLGFLGLPAPLSSQICTDANPAAYLYNQQTSCTREIADLATECTTLPALRASAYYQGFHIITSPLAFQVMSDTTTTSTTVNPVTDVTDTPLLNDLSLYNSTYTLAISADGPHMCIDSGGFESVCDLMEPLYSSGSCNNAVVKMKYTLTYNGTTGITNASVQFTFSNITQDMLPITQQFETKFMKEEEEAVIERSGNPGYVRGKPLLAGNMVAIEQDDGTERFVMEVDSNPENWLTMAKSSARGDCVDWTKREPITFGMSMRSGCFISLNFSECTVMNDAIRDTLLGANPFGYVARFGNVAPEVTGDWVQILTSGCTDQSIPGNQPGVCENVVTGLHQEFIYANVGSIANPQAMIIGAQYRFTCQAELRYQCVGAYCVPGNDVSQRVEISSSVGFIDASTRAVPQSAGKPKVTARLPEDFFCPFT